MPAIGMNNGEELGMDANPLSMFGDLGGFPNTSEPLLANGSICTCESCNERRQISQEAEQVNN